jgi:hypothetical protein
MLRLQPVKCREFYSGIKKNFLFLRRLSKELTYPFSVADFARCIENIQQSKEYENSAFSARNSLESRVEPFEDEAVYEIENVTYTLPTDFNYILLEGMKYGEIYEQEKF